MIFVNNLNIQFADKYLFRDVSGQVNSGDRIGLVGVNGAGKTTLLKLLAGETETDAGVITRGRYTTVGYLPQEAAATGEGRSLYQEAESAFAGVLALQEELAEVNHLLAETPPDSPEFAPLLARQGDLQHRLDHTDAHLMRARVEKVLLGLGFTEKDFGRDCASFSGGWFMRIMLAKLLLARPSCLLLDEPTNHLDIDTLSWIEEFLQGYDGAMVIISHDRAFLDSITNLTWELSLGRLTVYQGNYSRYVADKEERMAVQRAAYENQQAYIQQTMRFVDRFRSKSTKAKQAQSRLKQIEKMEIIELDETEKKIAFRFPPASASGRLAVETRDLAMRYGARKVFEHLSFELQRGDKLAVVGANGAGKSTLVRILAGLLKPAHGAVRFGHNVQLSYFGQHQAQELPQDLTVLETMALVPGERTTTETRSLLGAFLFSGSTVDKKVRVLSGGEKSRLALAKMIATPANLLVMDEPTNHLDMTSQEILQDALQCYDGTIIIVSHNRYFVDAFVNKVLEVKDGHATLIHGNVAHYLEKRKKETAQSAAAQASAAGRKETAAAGREEGAKGAANRKLARQEKARLRQEKNARLAPHKKAVDEAEREIARLEARRTELEKALADPELYRDEAAFAGQSREYGEAGRRLERWYAKWEQAQGAVESIEADYADRLTDGED